jgi:hypothetical protein
VKPLTRRRPFRIAVQALDDFRGPQFEVAANGTAMIEINSGVRICWRENKSNSIEAKARSSRSRLAITSSSAGIVQHAGLHVAGEMGSFVVVP